MSATGFYRRYLLPGFAFQSVVIAGGYGTGRELVEFFLRYGPWGGLLAMTMVSTVLWSLVCAVTFEFARQFQTFDYRTFFKQLLGPFWFLFEVCYFLLLLIVLAVIASAAGTLLEETIGLHYWIGVALMMGSVGLLTFHGSGAIESFFSIWSLVLYLSYFILILFCLRTFGPEIRASFDAFPASEGWFLGGVEYAAYNLGTIPAILFCLRHSKQRRDALCAGLLAGPIAMFPGFLFLLALSGRYPQVLEDAVPLNTLLAAVQIPVLHLLLPLVLFGTLIETGAGMIHAINQRVESHLGERCRSMPKWLRPALAIGLLASGAAIASFGLVALIAQGYGTITWGFLLVYVLPALTWGAWRIFRLRGDTAGGGKA